MSQQPFSRPGAVDLSGLRGPAPAQGQAGSAPAAGGGTAASGAYAVEVTEENFQSVLEASMNAPVLLAFYSRSRMPASGTLADDLATLSDEFNGKYLAGLVDIDAQEKIAQAMQIPSIPLLVAVIDGRPAPLLQDAPPLDQLRETLEQLFQQLTTQGVTGRHQPRSQAPTEDGDEEPESDPRYAPAQDALAAGDIDLAVVEYQKLVDANASDTEAAAGLAMAKVLQRTQGVDLNEARAAAADNPDDVGAQTLVADLDMLGGHVEDSFNRLVDLVRRMAGDDRDQARNHLLGLFAAVGNDDARVVKGRQNLASALF